MEQSVIKYIFILFTMNLYENLFEDKELFYGTKCNKIHLSVNIFYLQMNLLEHLCVNKELFYGTKCNKIHINASIK